VSDLARLRSNAEHARSLARSITDGRAQEALEDIASELDRRADEIEQQQTVEEI
jgi:hypothetical protein